MMMINLLIADYALMMMMIHIMITDYPLMMMMMRNILIALILIDDEDKHTDCLLHADRH